MKYMGAKRTMLKNGLGKLLVTQAEHVERFVDLFTGAASVAWYVAENTDLPVVAVDLQQYATTMARAVIARTRHLDSPSLVAGWINFSVDRRDLDPLWNKAAFHRDSKRDIRGRVDAARDLCRLESRVGPVWSAYGGHYFSPSQALTFDYLLSNLPASKPERDLCLAACISAASACVASPGHTAEPFQPTESAGPFIVEAWGRDPVEYCRRFLTDVAVRHAQTAGRTITADAVKVVATLKESDLAFVDPPYSSVQYSRFYHVLETIARGTPPTAVTGAGRYPPLNERPQSSFSNVSQAMEALIELLGGLAATGCTVVFTFPSGIASNGLSGKRVKEIAKEWFAVEDYSTVNGRFSTLGGNNEQRNARVRSSELILLMKPRSGTRSSGARPRP